MQCFGLFSSGRRRHLSFFWVRKNHCSSKWICNPNSSTKSTYSMWVTLTNQPKSEKVCHVCWGGGGGGGGEKGGVDEENHHDSATHIHVRSCTIFFSKRGSFIKILLFRGVYRRSILYSYSYNVAQKRQQQG